MTATAKLYCRPILENLENREMMDAGIGGALMQPLPNFGQGAQIRLLAQETSALQNRNNPLSQSLTQSSQALLAHSQQMIANMQAAADHIFSAWSHHADQVVHNIQGQLGAAMTSHSGYGQPFDDQKAGQVAHELFDTFIVAKGWNIWGIRSVTLENAYSLPDEKGGWHLKVLLGVHTADQKSYLLLDYDYLGTDRYGFVDFKLTGLHGADYFPLLEFAIRGIMDSLDYRERSEMGAQQAALHPPAAEQALPTAFNGWLDQTQTALGNVIASQAVMANTALIDAHLAQQG